MEGEEERRQKIYQTKCPSICVSVTFLLGVYNFVGITMIIELWLKTFSDGRTDRLAKQQIVRIILASELDLLGHFGTVRTTLEHKTVFLVISDHFPP